MVVNIIDLCRYTCWGLHARKDSGDGSRVNGSFHQPTRLSADYCDNQQHQW